MPLTDPGPLHRLAMVVPDLAEAAAFLVDVLGARSVAGIATIERDGARAWTGPAATLGVAFGWTA